MSDAYKDTYKSDDPNFAANAAPNGGTKVRFVSHYQRLGLHPSAGPVEIRRRYRELSKLYHPDTTTLPPEEAIAQFQALNQAYSVLSNPERRAQYDELMNYSSVNVIRPWKSLDNDEPGDRSAYLDPIDRPLSSGELFAIFSLLLTFGLCITLAIGVALWRGETFELPIAVLSQITFC
ncbi:MAG: J domain-containing protein [Cyanobacteria bacterium P01_C01_bin.89]